MTKIKKIIIFNLIIICFMFTGSCCLANDYNYLKERVYATIGKDLDNILNEEQNTDIKDNFLNHFTNSKTYLVTTDFYKTENKNNTNISKIYFTFKTSTKTAYTNITDTDYPNSIRISANNLNINYQHLYELNIETNTITKKTTYAEQTNPYIKYLETDFLEYVDRNTFFSNNFKNYMLSRICIAAKNYPIQLYNYVQGGVTTITTTDETNTPVEYSGENYMPDIPIPGQNTEDKENKYFIYSPSADIKYNDNYLLVKNAENIENYYLDIAEYNTNGKLSSANIIRKNQYYDPELWTIKSGDDYYINLNEKLVFFNNKIYQIELINPHGIIVDKSNYYTFINDFFENNPDWIPTKQNVKAGIINNLKGYYESTTSEELYLDIVIPSGEENNYQIQIEKMGIKNNWDNPKSSEYQSLITLNRTILSGELFTNENYTGIFYKIQLPNYYEFEVNNSLSEATNTGVGTDAYYRATLLKNYGTKIQETDIFYFSPLAKNPLTGIEGDNNDKNTGIIAEISKAIKNILDSILNALFTPNMNEITKFINNMSTAMNGNNLLSLNLYIISSQLNLIQTQNVGDFIISYGDIELFDQVIIPSNYINITQLVTQNEKLNIIYGYYKTIVTTIWIYLFASFLRNILFKILGLNWIGNLADYEESQTTKEYNRYDTDEDTGKITETKTYKHGKTTWNYRRRL